MAEINDIPYSGLTAISTFSGCGGSSLGYRMAGFRVLYANEFIEAARDVYAANFPTTDLDGRDIREVAPEEILERIGLERGELDVFDGSPPCASFSMAGKREKSWGDVVKYSETTQRVDDLFDEYIRLLRGIEPKVFVAENVSGLLRGTAKGYFKQILRDLKSSGYRVKAALLDAAYLGVPQTRRRVIYLGVREDVEGEPTYPKPLPYIYTIADALPHVRRFRATTGLDGWKDANAAPAPTVVQSDGGASINVGFSSGGFVETDISDYAIGEEYDKLGPGESSAKYFNLVRAHADEPCPTVTQTAGVLGAAGITHPFEKRKFTIAELRRISGFPDDFILTGSYRQQWERIGRAVPPPMMRAIASTIRDEILLKNKKGNMK